MYCPFLSYGKQYCYEVDCMGENCAFWDKKANHCYIAEFFMNQVDGSQAQRNLQYGNEEKKVSSIV